jgi:hypothetical protein
MCFIFLIGVAESRIRPSASPPIPGRHAAGELLLLKELLRF